VFITSEDDQGDEGCRRRMKNITDRQARGGRQRADLVSSTAGKAWRGMVPSMQSRSGARRNHPWRERRLCGQPRSWPRGRFVGGFDNAPAASWTWAGNEADGAVTSASNGRRRR